MPGITDKRCSRCGETKPLGAFHRDRARRDGRQRYCRSCNLANSGQWRRDHPEEMAEHSRRWRAAHPRYHAVHKWLSRTFAKTGRCDDCGNEGPTEWANISGEYKRDRDDFEELCSTCHGAKDAERNELRVAV